tara:strand:- start:199 stop:609 length:411 start_codon:yes stop_codon:yes gene_type:complete
MESGETVKVCLAAVFWDLLRSDDYFDKIRDTDEIEEFCDSVFRNGVGLSGDEQELYYRERLEAYVKEFAEKKGLKVYTEEDDRLRLDEADFSESELVLLREARKTMTDEEIAEMLEMGRLGKLEYMRRRGRLKKFN